MSARPAIDRPAQSIHAPVIRVAGAASTIRSDCLAIEEPLEIRIDALVGARRQIKSISITMRTPGFDAELAAGFLFTEGILRSPADIIEIVGCGQGTGAHDGSNTVEVRVRDHAVVLWPAVERHFYSTSSCGVCGKASLDALEVPGLQPITRDGFKIAAAEIHTLQEKVRAHQAVFEQTGGLHGAALFSSDGELLAVREDVGRHNAVDKLLGWQFMAGMTPLASRLLFLSGRASFELVQKALVAGIPMIVAVGAPSSLAVELAKRFDLTLIGFVRDGRFNIYNGEWRVNSR
ncbi:MAG: formate dehydrogenase accessory sulfurtransferase FdhD [Phycisphaerales bacterium]|nr:formate dehydrogenase accessory sulfurtransferase FdhD [Phycisphaerales bacterium]